MSRDLAELAITAGLQRYCTAVDTYDAVLFQALWTTDAQLDFGERYQGGPAGFMASLVEARSRTIAMSHELEEVSIDVSSDLASATSLSIVSAVVIRVGEDGEQRRLVRGRYEDRWVLNDGQWLMQHRRYRATSAI